MGLPVSSYYQSQSCCNHINHQIFYYLHSSGVVSHVLLLFVSIRFGLALISICSPYHIFLSHTVISISFNHMMVKSECILYWFVPPMRLRSCRGICSSNAQCTDITSCWRTSILSCSDPSYLLILIDTNSFTNIDTFEREFRDQYKQLHRISILDALTISCILSMCSFTGLVCSIYRYSIFRVDAYIPVSFNIPILSLHSILN